ncbi:mandelate racemase/muconate lactonizing enzyme family protein [Halorussus salinisoli]|uniref:mandelate racemase/muconate lactonizing enzyme family protein n=1 Tax=Halorussus salinisoli TaxID=2558242 RepID=UPI0010C1697F|nr:enolase C-terminal domain-like protein [Halorussus salinisoli]
MKIDTVRAIPVSVPFAVDFDVASGGVPAADHVLVEIETDAGVTGLGEASPMPFFTGETQETIVPVIESHLAPKLLGVDPSNLHAVHEAMDEIAGNPLAKTAVDIACHDAVGKALGVSVSTLLGGAVRDRITVGQSIGIKETERAVADAERYVDDDGFGSMKIKVGGDPERDLERVKAVMDAVGDRASIRLDGNEGYTADVAVKQFEAIEDYGDILLVEQPVPRDDVPGMHEVTRALSSPVLADESVFSPQDALQVVRRRAADIVNIKLMKAGGLFPARRIASLARTANMPLAIGSMVEMGVGTAAGAHFAACQPHATYPSDVKGPSLLDDTILKEPIRIEDGYTYVPSGNGLGVEIDSKKVERYQVD